MNIKIPAEIQEEIAGRVKKLRKKQQLTQAELAQKSGVSLASLKRFEQKGKIAFGSLLKIAYVLNVLEGFEELFRTPKDLPKSLDEIIKKKQK
tara:strand:- start:49 stop:327 length:279 start_codon:yes stop_codon:yes gene_type:complete